MDLGKLGGVFIVVVLGMVSHIYYILSVSKSLKSAAAEATCYANLKIPKSVFRSDFCLRHCNLRVCVSPTQAGCRRECESHKGTFSFCKKLLKNKKTFLSQAPLLCVGLFLFFKFRFFHLFFQASLLHEMWEDLRFAVDWR